jgi:hypothetical protein
MYCVVWQGNSLNDKNAMERYGTRSNLVSHLQRHNENEIRTTNQVLSTCTFVLSFIHSFIQSTRNVINY